MIGALAAAALTAGTSAVAIRVGGRVEMETHDDTHTAVQSRAILKW